MAFIGPVKKGVAYTPGYFLANNEDCTRLTMNFKNDDTAGIVTTVGTAKYVKAGTIYPKKSAGKAKGIVYEDVDVTNGEAPGSVVIAGTVYKDRLPDTEISEVQDDLKNITFLDLPTVTRPAYAEE